MHVYIHLYVRSSFGAHNFDIFYATRFNFGMIVTKTNTFDFMVELPLSGAGSVYSENHVTRSEVKVTVRT